MEKPSDTAITIERRGAIDSVTYTLIIFGAAVGCICGHARGGPPRRC